MNEIKNIIKNMSRFDKLFAIVFAISLITIQIITDSTMISLLCSFLGILYVILVRLGHRYSLVLGTIQAIIYCVISFKSNILGDFMLNAYNVVFMTYGYMVWSKHSVDNKLEIRDLNKKQIFKLLLVMLLAYISLVFVLSHFNSFNFWLDSFTTIMSMVGLYLTANRFRQCWIVWCINNVFHMILWITLFIHGNSHAPIMILMFCMYLFNSCLGLYQWYKKK